VRQPDGAFSTRTYSPRRPDRRCWLPYWKGVTHTGAREAHSDCYKNVKPLNAWLTRQAPVRPCMMTQNLNVTTMGQFPPWALPRSQLDKVSRRSLSVSIPSNQNVRQYLPRQQTTAADAALMTR
jgi:hypothetical protein